VEAVGELDHEHADVARHRHHHLAEVLGLPLLARGERELADLGHPVDQLGDVDAELPGEIVLGGLGVLEDVVEEPRGHRRHVHLEVDEEAGDFEGMRQIGLAGGALLAVVGLLGEAVGALDEAQISRGLILRDLVDERLELRQPVRLPRLTINIAT
jgi:hypothetical protein